MNTFVPYTLHVTLLYSSTIIFWNFFGKTVRHFLLVFKSSIGHNRFSVGQGPMFARDFSWVISNVRPLFQLDTVQFLTDCQFFLLNLIKHYLTDRSQRVLLDGQCSNWQPILVGVPQGSILGPLFFLIYVNDLPDRLKSNVKLFADDTSLFSVVKNKEESASDLILSLPYLGDISLQTTIKLRKSFKGILNCCKLQIVFKIQRKPSVFQFKDRLSFDLVSGVGYKYTCGRSNSFCYGETDKHLNVRSGEHIGISPVTFGKIKPSKESAFRDHLLICNNILIP